MSRSESSSDIKAKPTAIALMGPTAAGKTDLAIAIHEQLGAEIISVDSTLVYRQMNIGTAKPSMEELARAPHRLIDIRDPSEPYSVADFCADATREIESIIDSGKTPLLTGGTMMYFKALLEGMSDLPEANETIRREIESEAGRHGWPHLHTQLAEVDPASAAKIHPNHSQRLGRAIEVYRITGKPMSSFHGQMKGGLLNDFSWVQLAIAPSDRSVLHRRIALRFDQMIEQGVVDEVRSLRDRGDLHKDLPAIRAVGYRQIWEFLDGEYGFDEMREKGVAATRQLAKRQLTWLRKWPELNWVDSLDKSGQELSKSEIIHNSLNFLAKRTI